jgi:hypothetical protein
MSGADPRRSVSPRGRADPGEGPGEGAVCPLALPREFFRQNEAAGTGP